jgi:hypothetical protein
MTALPQTNPPVLRAHRKHPDTTTPLDADVREYYIDTEDLPKRRTWLERHLLQIGVGMLVMLTLFYVSTTYVFPFVQNTTNHWNCGANLICQYDYNVGHKGTSHFLTEYWQGQVIIIELQNNDPRRAKLYSQTITIVGETKGKHLVSLQFDYLSRHPLKGKPDIIATVSGVSLPIIFYNTGDGFTTKEPTA